ncbi:hypothetical protein ACN9MZ_16525 [Pseudoduganella sp. S-14]|uniref:hypothetical protein n=1 Tax=Pseudoduganella sp. S-14 TaxID=3404065 RepID=UPI003CF74993
MSGHGTQRFDVQTQRRARDFPVKAAYRLGQARDREHHVDRDRQLRLQSLGQRARLGLEAIHAAGGSPRRIQQGTALLS